MAEANYGIQFATSQGQGQVNPVGASLNEAKRVATEHSKLYKRFFVNVIAGGVVVATYCNGRRSEWSSHNAQ